MKQVISDEDIGGLDLCGGAIFRSQANLPENDWLRSLCERIEESANRDEGSQLLFEQYLVVMSESDEQR